MKASVARTAIVLFAFLIVSWVSLTFAANDSSGLNPLVYDGQLLTLTKVNEESIEVFTEDGKIVLLKRSPTLAIRLKRYTQSQDYPNLTTIDVDMVWEGWEGNFQGQLAVEVVKKPEQNEFRLVFFDHRYQPTSTDIKINEAWGNVTAENLSVDVLLKDIVDPHERCRAMSLFPWYFVDAAEKTEGFCSPLKTEEPLNYVEIKQLFGGFSFHLTNEDGFVVFYTPYVTENAGVLSCSTPTTEGLRILGLTYNTGHRANSKMLKYKFSMGLVIYSPLEKSILVVTVPGDAYLSFVPYWDITISKDELILGPVYKIPTEPFSCLQ